MELDTYLMTTFILLLFYVYTFWDQGIYVSYTLEYVIYPMTFYLPVFDHYVLCDMWILVMALLYKQ